MAELGQYFADYLRRTKRTSIALRHIIASRCRFIVLSPSTVQLSIADASVMEYIIRRNLPSQAGEIYDLVQQLVRKLGHSPLTANLVHFARSLPYRFLI
jgi:hypothetical protein